MAKRSWMKINAGASAGRVKLTGLNGYGTVVGADTPSPDDDYFVGVALVPVEDSTLFREAGEQRHPPLGTKIVIAANRFAAIEAGRVNGGTLRPDGGVDVWFPLELKPGEFTIA